MAQTTIKIDVNVHGAALEICKKSGRWLVEYIAEAIQEKNEKELPELLNKLRQKQESREAFIAYCNSILGYNVDKAIKEKDEFMQLHKKVFNVA